MAVLRIVGMPIGDPDDITLRALRALKEAELFCVEDPGVTSRFFKRWEVPYHRDRVRLVNEHTRPEELADICAEIERSSSSVLVSDAGMPVFCDPGLDLMALCDSRNIPVQVIPGPTALMTAVVRVGVPTPFYFAGFPPRKTGEREQFFRKMNQMTCAVIFYETPYRLEKLLGEIKAAFQPDKKVVVCVNLTMPDETIVRKEAKTADKIKVPQGPPVVIVHATHH